MAFSDKGAVFANQFALSRKKLVKKMALIIFKYCLPILLGYTLFVGISGRYIPFMRPRALAQRPSWFLGLWTGVTVAIIMSYGLHLAYQMNLNDVFSLLTPGAWILGAAMLPGIICYLWYRTKINRQIDAEFDQRKEDQIEFAEAAEYDATLALDSDATAELDETLQLEPTSIVDIDERTVIWSDSDEMSGSFAEHDETQLFEIDPLSIDEPILVSEETELGSLDSGLYEIDAQPLSQHEITQVVAETDTDQAANAEALEIHSTTSTEALAQETADHASNLLEAKRLSEALEEETRLRKELENHLRITRKGLAELDSESRNYESEKARALTELEKELAEKTKRTAAAEARAEREADKCAALENEVVLLRQDTLKATKDSRESIEARARALSTANKATTFARQAMEIRTRLETQLHDAEEELDNKQKTISSLIKALEKEKARTKEQVDSMAKQLILHEKQLQARRTLEEVSRSVDNKLSTRLVKKVAKSRG